VYGTINNKKKPRLSVTVGGEVYGIRKKPFEHKNVADTP
jgi:hypothetical protein